MDGADVIEGQLHCNGHRRPDGADVIEGSERVADIRIRLVCARAVHIGMHLVHHSSRGRFLDYPDLACRKGL